MGLQSGRKMLAPMPTAGSYPTVFLTLCPLGTTATGCAFAASKRAINQHQPQWIKGDVPSARVNIRHELPDVKKSGVTDLPAIPYNPSAGCDWADCSDGSASRK
jgi:hypothetical protein